MNPNVALLLGRVLASVPFILGGYEKLTATSSFVTGFARLGVPYPNVAVVLAIVIELIGGLVFVLGIQTRLVSLGFAAYCIITALIAHTNLSDRMQELNFVKNLSMAGGFLAFAAAGAGAYSVDAIRTRRGVAA